MLFISVNMNTTILTNRNILYCPSFFLFFFLVFYPLPHSTTREQNALLRWTCLLSFDSDTSFLDPQSLFRTLALEACMIALLSLFWPLLYPLVACCTLIFAVNDSTRRNSRIVEKFRAVNLIRCLDLIGVGLVLTGIRTVAKC